MDGLSRALSEGRDRTILPERFQALLDRGAGLAIAIERWQRAGIWIVTRSDPDYPHRLKRRLEILAPPVLFGCGSRRLLDMGGIAVVVESGKSGRTWNGATENLKKGWVHLWVKPSTGPTTGNAELVRLGGQVLTDELLETGWEETFATRGGADLKSQESATGGIALEATVEMVSEPSEPVVCVREGLDQAIAERVIVKHKRPVAYELAGRQLSMLGGDVLHRFRSRRFGLYEGFLKTRSSL